MSNEHSTQPAGSTETRRSSKGEWLSRVMDANAALAADDPRALTCSELAVLMAVGASANDYTLSDAWPSVDTIAARARVSARTAKRALARLRDAGWLRVTRQGGGAKGQPRATTAYALAYPEVTEPATSDPRGVTHDTPRGDTHDTPTGDTHDTPRGDTHDTRNGSSEVVPSEVVPMKWLPENTSDAPPRRCTPAADATGEAIARAVSESDPESNSEHGPCATCAQEPGSVEVLCNPSGKAHLLDSLSPGQRKIYTHATVIHYCLECARRAPLRRWWTHTPAESVA